MAEVLIAEGHEVEFAGTPTGLEASLAPEAGLTFHAVKARGFDRSNPFTLISSAAVIAWSALRTVRLLKRVDPDVVAGFGGYVSLPVGIAAVIGRRPLVLHEQNSVPGLANKMLSRWSAAVGVTYQASACYMARSRRVELTGNPVRPSVLSSDRSRGRASLGLDPGATALLVFGGSRGARHLNDAMVGLARRLMSVPALQVLHVAGRIEAASVAERIDAVLEGDSARYRVVDYIDAMGDAIAAADVIVARAGATSIAEITAIGRAAILVPYPYATDDHQTLNAKAVEQAGGALVVEDSVLDGESFSRPLVALLEDAGRREEMASASATLGRRDAARRVAAIIADAARIREEMR